MTPMTPMLPQLTVKSAALWVCVLYTLLTVISSSVQLLQGIEHDTNLHLLARFAVTVVGVGSIAIFTTLQHRFRRAPTLKAAGITYLITIAVVLTLTWVFGRFESLHPDAYRDIALNFTFVWVGVLVVITVAPRATQRLQPSRLQERRSRTRR
ncbi:MAG: hypothetical protein EA389_12540 [Ilumatobacter sp.]|nr:MAG: hypothetical protein EA389_12540 [Ilumatobacter sp.]